MADPNNMPNPNSPANRPPLTPGQQDAAQRQVARGWAWVVERYPALGRYGPGIAFALTILAGGIGYSEYDKSMKGPAPAAVKDEPKPEPKPAPKVDPAVDFEPLLIELRSIGKRIDAGHARIEKLLTDEPPSPKPTPPGPVPAERFLPAEVVGNVGEPLYVKAQFVGELRWIVPPDTPAHWREHGDELQVTGKVDGQFRIGLAVITKGRIAPVEWTLVKVGRAPIPPPGPDPIPEPTDEFYKSLKAGWMMEAAADKAMRGDLAALYSESVGYAKNDKTLTTAKQLFDKMHAARLTLFRDAKDALPHTRAAITAYLDTNLPRTISAPLDEATRKKAATHFGVVSQYLSRLP